MKTANRAAVPSTCATLRKLKLIVCQLILVGSALSAAAQSTELHSFTALNKPVPDGSPAGMSDVRTITSSIVNLAAVKVRLKISGQYNGDLYAYLRHANSLATNFVVLLNRPGRTAGNLSGYGDSGVDVTFDQASANDIHLYRNVVAPPPGTPLTGTWQPDGRRADPFAVLDTSPRNSSLSSFVGDEGSGEWTLFVADVDAGASHLLVSWELELIGATLPPITWSNPADITYGTALGAAQLNASAGSVAGVFIYDPPAGTVLNSGNNQNLTVLFFPNDTANYSPNSRTVSINVLKAPLTVAGTSTSRYYGDPNSAFTGTITGIKNSDAITATYACTAVATSPVGGYPIVPTPSGAALVNYNVTLVNGTLTVNPAVLTVTANSASRTYGDPNPAFSGTIAGVKNGETITATYSSAATPTSAFGTYPIVPTPAGATLANYTQVLNSGTLTVNKAILSLLANNSSRAYGDANPAFTGSFSGAKNSETFTLSFSTTATPTSPIGNYAIVPGATGPTIANYNLSPANGTLTIGQASLVVTANNASRPYGDANPAFTGTITGIKNGEPITAAYSSAAVPTSTVGAYSIVPSPSGATLANYSITLNNGTLTVNPAPLTVAAANATRSYGDPNPAFTGTITGIKNSEAITASYSSAATPVSSVGTYAIVPSPSGATLANYSVTLNNGTLTVAAAPLTISASNAARTYGDANPAFTGTITGIKNGEAITATYSTAAVPVSPIGAYPIIPTPSGTTLANYAVTLNNGVLTVNPAGLTVAANNASRFYGDPNPAFTGSVTGTKNGETITASYSSSALATSPFGTYSIVPTPAGATLANYTVTLVNGTLTVNKAALIVAASNASRSYGDPNPAFSGTITGIKNSEAITATYSTTAVPTSPIGDYSIVPVAAGATLANYNVTLNNGILTVNRAGLTITANNTSRLYGDPNPAFSGTITGIKNSEGITASYSSSATVTSPVGSYSIVPAPAGTTLGNYTVTLNNGTLTVNQAGLTITANNASRLFGTVNPTSTGTITGIRNGDAITATYSSAATLSSPVGSYPIVPTPAGAALPNYAVTLNNGILTVTQASSSGTLAASANPVLPGQAVTFTMTLAPVAPTVGAPSGAVQFRIDGNPAGAPVNLVAGVASLTTSSLSAGNHTVVAEYPGDVNFRGTTNTLTPAILINTAPVAVADTFDRIGTSGAKIEISALLANDTDADGNAVSFVSAGPATANGGTVAVQAPWLFYTPPAGSTNTDTFSYTIKDIYGAEATGTVTVLSKPGVGPALNLTITPLGNGSFRLRFDGIPNRATIVQYSTSIVLPVWTNLASGVSDSVGIFEAIDTPPAGSAGRYYRALYP